MRSLSPRQDQNESKVDFSQYWRIVWRKKYLVMIPLVLSGLISTIGVRFLSPVYESSSVIRVQHRDFLTKEVAEFIQIQQRRRMQDFDFIARLESELMSSSFLDQLIHRLGVANNPALIASAEIAKRTRFPTMNTGEIVRLTLRGRLRNKFAVENVGPGMFRISCFDFNPESCYLLANAVTNLFIELQEKRQLAGLEEAGEFSEEQLAVYKARMDESARKLESVNARLTGAAVDSNPVDRLNLTYAQSTRQQLDIQVREGEAVIDRISGNLTTKFGSIPLRTTVWDDSELQKLKNSLVENRRAQLLFELGKKRIASVDETGSQAQIDEAIGSLQRHLSQLIQRSVPNLEADYKPLLVEYYFQIASLEAYRAKRYSLSSYINSFRSTLQRTSSLEKEAIKLQGQIETNRSLYNSFLRSKTSTQITEAVQNTNLGTKIEVVETPIQPFSPVRPNKLKILIFAMVFGGFIGVGGLIFTEYLDNSFRSVEDIEQKLELRVLGTIPHFGSGSKWNKARARKQTIIWVTTSVVLISVTLIGFYFYGKSTAQPAFNTYVTTVPKK